MSGVKRRVSRVARRVMGFLTGRHARAVWVVVGGVAAVVVVGWLWHRGPHLAADTRAGLKPADQVQAVGQYHTAVLQGTAAIGGVIALAYTARNYRLSRRGQTTDRFTKALERLGSTDLYVRIGGVYALEQVLRDSPEHHANVVDVLVAFVRAHTRLTAPARVRRDTTTHQGTHAVALSVLPEPLDHPVEPHADVQAALTVLGRLPHHSRPTARLNLADLHLAGIRLDRANLAGALLRRTNLAGAQLRGSNLTGADLSKANLARALLTEADLTHARLIAADLTGTRFTRANLTGARLNWADSSRPGSWRQT